MGAKWAALIRGWVWVGPPATAPRLQAPSLISSPRAPFSQWAPTAVPPTQVYPVLLQSQGVAI